MYFVLDSWHCSPCASALFSYFMFLISVLFFFHSSCSFLNKMSVAVIVWPYRYCLSKCICNFPHFLIGRDEMKLWVSFLLNDNGIKIKFRCYHQAF